MNFNSKIHVYLSPQKKRIFFDCDFALNSVVKKVPAIKFEKSAKLWSASFSMQNIKFLFGESKKIGSLFEFDAEVLALIKKREREINEILPVDKEPFPFPEIEFKFEPYQYQKEALDFVSSMNIFALFMDMGLGKSYVTLYKFMKEYIKRNVNTLLIVCPTSLRRNWYNELKTHMTTFWWERAHVSILDLQSSQTLKEIEAKKSKAGMHILIVGIEALSVGEKKGRAWDVVNSYVKDKEFFMFIDESSDIKNMQSNRTENCIALGQMAKIRGIGTGTEISNSVIDLYSQFQFLHPDIIGIGSLSAFKARYVEFGGYENKQIIGYKNIEELMEVIRPFVFKRQTKECGLNLPETTGIIRTLQMTPEQKAMYNQIKKEKLLYIKTIDQTKLIDTVIDAYNKLQQVTGGFVMYETGKTEITKVGSIRIVKDTERLIPIEQNPKIKELVRIAKENPQKSIIIWAKFTEEVDMIIEALESAFGVGCCTRFDGEVKDADREIGKTAFLGGETRFFVSKASSGGKGLTLNISDLVIYYSNTFKYVDREQSLKRNHRIGQDKHVTYIDLCIEKSIDEDVLETLLEKRNLADFVKERLTHGVGGLLT